MPYAVGVDVGTTNTKAVLCELPSCNPVLIERFPSPKITSHENTDYDVDGLINGIFNSLNKCAKWLGDKSNEIEFVSIASIGESGVLVYPDGSYSKKSIFWYDNRGEEYSKEAISSGYSRTLYQITGVPTHSNSALFKILWMRDHGSSLEGAKWLTMADFIAWRLCGKAFQDRTLASRTSAYDVSSDEMSAEILSHYHLPKGLFAELIPSGVSRGYVTSGVCTCTGLPANCSVRVSGHDHMSGAVACDLKRKSEALNSTGTSEGLLLLSSSIDLDERTKKSQITKGRFVLPDIFTSYASVPAAGLSFQWALQTLGLIPDKFYECGVNRLYSKYVQGGYTDTRLVYIPHLRGSGPPNRNTDSRACFYGMSDATSQDDLVFATYLGVCSEFMKLCSGMTGGKSLPDDLVIKVIGPAAKDQLWMQMKADTLGRRFVACDVQEAVARGSVIVSARTAGYEVHPSFDTRVYEPDFGRNEFISSYIENCFEPLSSAIFNVESNFKC